MTEVWFYHLQAQPLERALPALIEKGVARGWRVIVQTVDDLRLRWLDDLLWTYTPESFLPHSTSRDPDPDRHQVLITCGADNPNGAALRMYVDGAAIELTAEATYERVILLFDGGNDEQLGAARQQWSRLKAEGVSLAYWQQSAEGRWEKRM